MHTLCVLLDKIFGNDFYIDNNYMSITCIDIIVIIDISYVDYSLRVLNLVNFSESSHHS